MEAELLTYVLDQRFTVAVSYYWMEKWLEKEPLLSQRKPWFHEYFSMTGNCLLH